MKTITKVGALLGGALLLSGLTIRNIAKPPVSPVSTAGSALTEVSAPVAPTPGAALGNGLAQSGSTTNLTVKSNMSSYAGAYLGNVYVFGLYQGKKVLLQNISVGFPVWQRPASGEVFCTAAGDLLYQTKPARLTWFWRTSPTVGRTGVAWRVQQYQGGDAPNVPTGTVLAASDAVNTGPMEQGKTVPISGQVWIRLPEPFLSP